MKNKKMKNKNINAFRAAQGGKTRKNQKMQIFHRDLNGRTEITPVSYRIMQAQRIGCLKFGFTVDHMKIIPTFSKRDNKIRHRRGDASVCKEGVMK